MLQQSLQKRLGYFILITILSTGLNAQTKDNNGRYQDLIELFKEWRMFETPPMIKGCPDYTLQGRERRWPLFQELRANLMAIDTSGWSIQHRADWTIVWAEMNGYDFNHRVLKPWERDPAFYKSLWLYRSDVPAHEGPTHHATTELWTYSFPLNNEERERLMRSLEVIPLLNRQAMENLKGNARDLWKAGIRDIETQSADLADMLKLPGISKDPKLRDRIQQAINATDKLAEWLKAQLPHKTGPSGIGKDQYTWYQQNVHLVPLSWDDEVMLLKRELARAWASLKLEEHRNRNLPDLNAANSTHAYQDLAKRSAKSLLDFLDKGEIVTVKPYFKQALDEHLGAYVPAEHRNFFWITAHYDPRPLYSHFYHWFELARMDTEPNHSPIRQLPLLYNIFDSRNEGMATAVEEMFMQAGLYDDDPRVREIVYIMIAQRAARGLGSLYAHANLMSMEEAGAIHSEYTPRGWMKTEKELLIFEQHLYLRQPGYGTSYITGKYLMEQTLMEYGRQLEAQGKTFSLKSYFDGLNSIGNIPLSLAAWELVRQPLPFEFVNKE